VASRGGSPRRAGGARPNELAVARLVGLVGHERPDLVVAEVQIRVYVVHVRAGQLEEIVVVGGLQGAPAVAVDDPHGSTVPARSYDRGAVEQLFHDINRAYQQHIEAPGKETHFLILVAFVCSFAFIRTSAHMIRAQVSWWPGNVQTKSGTHIHHLVWGILLLLVMGYLGLATHAPSPWFELIAIAFGIGMGLTLDEFALWLNLEDVYWSQKGRQSIDAAVVTVALLVIALLGLQFWIDVYDAVLVLCGFDRGSSWIAIPLQVAGVALAIVCFRRGRTLIGVVGLFVPLVALVGALAPQRQAARSST
jgi:hypothetical protein